MRRLLLVDDEENVINALMRAIRAHMGSDLHIETFNDPYEALKRCSLARFDVVMSDYRMPQLTGVEFLRALKEIAPDTIRILLTASTEFDTVRSAINEAAVYRFISKPWDVDDLIAQLKEAFALREAENLSSTSGVKDDAPADPLLELEREEPGITKVNWGPNGEIIL